MSGYEDVWETVYKKFGLSKEEFEKKVKETIEQFGNFITPRAAAFIVAKDLGVSAEQVLNPPIIGRLLEVGPIKKSTTSRGENPYVLFIVVTETERLWSAAFGEENVKILKESDDKVLKISNYGKAVVRGRELIRVTEKSKIDVLEDNVLPPTIELRPAWADSLKSASENKGTFVIKAVVISEDVTEYFACPICKKSVEMTDSEWYCPEHGKVDAEIRKIHHYELADKSGIYSAVLFSAEEKEKLFKKAIITKGYFKGNEFQISKIYKVADSVNEL